MKILTFQARRFRWKSHSKTLTDASDAEVEEEVDRRRGGLLARRGVRRARRATRARFQAHAETREEWLAGKRDLRTVVLHSFTHLGGENAQPEFAREFIEDLAERLRTTNYVVFTTPFGWFCEWDLSVDGESLAEVWKEV